MFVGMPSSAAKNIPLMFVDTSKYSEKKKRYGMKRNPNFVVTPQLVLGVLTN